MRKLLSALCIAVTASVASANVQDVKVVTGKIRCSENSEIILPDGAKYSMQDLGAKKRLTPVKPAKAAEELVNVTFKVTSKASPLTGTVFNKEMMETFDFSGKEGTIQVPKGVYDMYVDFDRGTCYFVFKENVEVKGDMVVEFDQSEANIPVEFHFFDENNKELFVDMYENGALATPGTANTMLKLSSLIHKDYGTTAMIVSEGHMTKDFPMEFYVNKLSDKYFLGMGTSINVGSKYYMYKNLVEDIKPTVINSDPSNLQKLVTYITPTPAMKDEPTAHYPGVESIVLNDGFSIIKQRAWTGEDFDGSNNVVTYIDCPESPVDAPCNMNMIVSPVLTDTYTVVDDGYGEYMEFTHIRGCSAVGNAKEGIRYVNGGSDLDLVGFNIPEGEMYNKYYPGHPEFSFDCPNGKTSFGNNTPLLIYCAMKFKSGSTVQGIDKFRYVGRKGESFDTDANLAKVTNKDIAEGTEVTIINENVEVDGMPGKNTTIVVFDDSKNDYTAPTFQMLSFKNAEGVLTDRLESVQGARLLLAGGDFSYVDVPTWPYIGHFICEDPASVKAFYAPHGTDSWTELTVKEDKSKYFMPAFGNFYDADLSGVKAEGKDAWFDVRVEIADAAGNYQKQTLSPAFRVNSTGSAIEQVASDADNALVVNGKTVMIANGEDAEMTVYSIDGRTLQSVYANNIDFGNMASGIYIVTAVTADGNVFSTKIAL